MTISDYNEIKNWISAGDNYLVVSHINPDGDATGSLLAIAEILKHLQKQAVYVNEGTTPARFSYLRGYESIVNDALTPLNEMYERVICVDCADINRVGDIARWFSPQATILNIDHHSTNNHYGHYTMINDTASSTCEVIFDWVRAINLPVNPDLAAALYTGYLTDTGGFRYANTTPKVLRDASQLVELGAPPHEIAKKAIETVSYAHVKLLSHTLSSLELAYDGKVALLYVPLSVLEETGAETDDTEGLVDYGRNIDSVEVSLLFRETESGVKVSFRSKEIVNVSQIAQQFGGGGHIRAAGCTIAGDLNTARNLLLPIFERYF